jgi:hypothetical protein
MRPKNRLMRLQLDQLGIMRAAGSSLIERPTRPSLSSGTLPRVAEEGQELETSHFSSPSPISGIENAKRPGGVVSIKIRRVRPMALMDLFRKRPKAASRAALTDWLDSRAAHLTQKAIHDYSRARAGLSWQQIYSEPMFIEALDVARWRAFPLGLALVGEMAEGALRSFAPQPAALEHFPQKWEPVLREKMRQDEKLEPSLVPGRSSNALAEAVAACALEAFDRHPVFPSIGAEEWAVMRAELRQALLAAGLHPPKPVKDIAVPVGARMFELMPMHPTIKEQDSLIVKNQLRTSLISLHEEFVASFDRVALAAALASRA